MDRNGSRDEKPSYQELASALRWIVYVPKNYFKSSKEEQLKIILRQSKELVSKLDEIESRAYRDIKFGEGAKSGVDCK